MTSTDICNMALAYIGEGRVRDINDDNETAKLCRLYYDQNRKMLLSQYMWGFARRVERLAPMEGASVHGFSYAYMYPEKCLYLYRVLNNDEETPAGEREEFGVYAIDNGTKVIACNAEGAIADYVMDVTDPNVYSYVFIEALARKLAADLAMPLVGSGELYRMQFELYQGALLEAKNINARERHYTLDFESAYLQARRL